LPDEHALIGAEEIAGFLRISKRSLHRKFQEMSEAGAIWKKWMGRPPRKVYYSFPSILQKYEMLLAKKNR